MEEECGHDTTGDAGDHVAELDGADVVEEGGGAAAVTHHGWLDLSVSQGILVLHHSIILSPVITETLHRSSD